MKAPPSTWQEHIHQHVCMYLPTSKEGLVISLHEHQCMRVTEGEVEAPKPSLLSSLPTRTTILTLNHGTHTRNPFHLTSYHSNARWHFLQDQTLPGDYRLY